MVLLDAIPSFDAKQCIGNRNVNKPEEEVQELKSSIWNSTVISRQDCREEELYESTRCSPSGNWVSDVACE